MSTSGSKTQPGDLVQLVSATNKTYLLHLKPGGGFQSHRGTINHDDIIDVPWGSVIRTHQGSPYYVLKPTLYDLLLATKRNTQIMYPKDISYAIVRMGIAPGQHVLEAGTGSGALTTALAWTVGPQGRVTSYDMRPQMQQLARRNLKRAGLLERVIFRERDITVGFDELDVDALFLDVPTPHDFLAQAHAALKYGSSIGIIVPTTNQVERLLPGLHPNGFGFIEVLELMLRFYKPIPSRLRPTDRMVAHTGYLIFARKVYPLPPSERPASETEPGEASASDTA